VTAQHAARYAAFRDKYASLEDGQAAARFVDQLLTNGS
jgi:CDP-glycerol glycerophosphotransferase (TagB/SpsB family)